jgi:hypothetical protein
MDAPPPNSQPIRLPARYAANSTGALRRVYGSREGRNCRSAPRPAYSAHRLMSGRVQTSVGHNICGRCLHAPEHFGLGRRGLVRRASTVSRHVR